MITFETSVDVPAPKLKIYVGHSGYNIQHILPTVTFQYDKTLTMYEGETRVVTAYISGEGTTVLEVWCDEQNITVLGVSSGDQKGSRLVINSSENSESVIRIRVKALRENKVGSLFYKLQTGNKTDTFVTKININPPEEKTGGVKKPSNVMSIFVITSVFLVVLYITMYSLRRRRR